MVVSSPFVVNYKYFLQISIIHIHTTIFCKRYGTRYLDLFLDIHFSLSSIYNFNSLIITSSKFWKLINTQLISLTVKGIILVIPIVTVWTVFTICVWYSPSYYLFFNENRCIHNTLLLRNVTAKSWYISWSDFFNITLWMIFISYPKYFFKLPCKLQNQ